MFSTNIENSTLGNKMYRKIIYTDSNLQIALMSLKPGEDIPKETHNGSQFIRVESGKGVVKYGSNTKRLSDGIAIVIPKGQSHYIRNTSKTDTLNLYTVYTPPQHKPKERELRQP